MKRISYLLIVVLIEIVQPASISGTTEMKQNTAAATWSGEDVDWLLAMARVLGEAGRPIDARLYYWAFLFHRPENSRAWNGLGHTYLLVEDSTTAIEHYSRGWEFGNVDSLRYLGLVHFRAGNTEALRAILPDMMKNVESHVAFAVYISFLAFEENDPSFLVQVFDRINLRELARREEEAETIEELLRRFDRRDLAERIEEAIENRRMRIQARQERSLQGDPSRGTSPERIEW